MKINLKIRIHNSNIIPCATDNLFTPNKETRKLIRDKLNLTNKFVITYLGSAVKYQLPEKMCELVAEIISHIPKAHFLVLTHDRDTFYKFIDQAGISEDKYTIISLEHDKVFEVLQIGDIGLILRDDSIVNIVSSPTKFGEYCLCGVPIIITNYVGDYSKSVQQHSIGYIVDLTFPIRDNGLFKFLDQVQQHRDEFTDRCHDFLENNLTWDIHGPILNDLLQSLLIL